MNCGGNGWQEAGFPVPVSMPDDRRPAAAPVSPERESAVQAAAEAAGKSRATIYRWLANQEARGLGGLARKKHADRDERRVILTRKWDSAVDFDEETKERIAQEMRTSCNSLWANAGTDVGRRWITRLAAAKLVKLTIDAG